MIGPNNTPSLNRFCIAVALVFVLVLISLTLLFKGKLVSRVVKVKPLEVIVSTGSVKEGDIMTSILTDKGLPPDLATKIQSEIGKSFNLRRMMPGHNYEVFATTNGIFQRFVYHDDPTHSYSIEKSSMGILSTTENTRQAVWNEKVITSEVKEFLYRDLMKQGYDETFVANFIAELGDKIFPWQIDFFTEQRPGDVVQVLFQQEYLVGSEKPLNRIRILAASYTGKGTRKKENFAIRYRIPGATKDDFFDLEGKAIRKAFLRAPFTFANFRISSGFSQSRYHPVLRIWRPHHGTDYAAPYGTRVSCIGNGHVICAGWKGGYGKCVEVRHNSKYVSRYGHLSKIAVRLGQSIGEGGYVGNVGMTGLATGPHLHFEMIVDGVSRNFVKLDFPSASSVPNESLNDFNKVRDDLLHHLQNGAASQTIPKYAQASSMVSLKK